MLFGGADELGAVSIRVEEGGGEVASSSSSMTLETTVRPKMNAQNLQ